MSKVKENIKLFQLSPYSAMDRCYPAVRILGTRLTAFCCDWLILTTYKPV